MIALERPQSMKPSAKPAYVWSSIQELNPAA
jgi:hypothetical protein